MLQVFELQETGCFNKQNNHFDNTHLLGMNRFLN